MSLYGFGDEKECPLDPRDAYYEGRRSREYERNPYEHGRDAFASHECREAHEEWNRGHRSAERKREEREQEEAQLRAHEARMREQREIDEWDPY